MSVMSIKPSRWALQGFLTERPNFYSNLIALLPCWEGAGAPFDLVRREQLIQVSTPVWSQTPRGISLHTDTVAKEGWQYPDSDWVPTTNVTIFIHKQKDDTTNRNSSGFGVLPSTNERCQCHLPFSDGTVFFDFGGTTSPERVSVAGLTFGDDIWAFRAGDSGAAIYQNSIKRASTSGAISRTASTVPFGIGAAVNLVPEFQANADLAKFSFFCMFNVELTDNEIAAVSKDIFAMIRMVDEAGVVYAVAAAGRIMSSLADAGGLAGRGGIAGIGGGLAG